MCKKCGFGNHIIILHPNGFKTIYAHLLNSPLQVAVGVQVKAGQVIAIADNSGFSTGSHLHFEVIDPSGKSVDPYSQYPNCGPNSLWATCPPVPYDSSFDDADEDDYTIAQGDCNDNNPSINPGVKELCDDVDNDCDNQADEDWQLVNTKCLNTKNGCVGEGIWICSQNKNGLLCTAPVSVPQPEICDSQDNDCDGQTDEDFKTGLVQDLGNPCTVGIGACQNQGTMVCTKDGKATVCSVDALQSDCEGKECGGDGCGGTCGDCPLDAVCAPNQGICLWDFVPTVFVTPPSGPQGTTFDQPGEGFTPNSIAELHFVKPDGTEYDPVQVDTNLDGAYSHSYTSLKTDSLGVYQYYAIDVITGILSNTVFFEITCAPDCQGKECGDDSCGGSCGTCANWQYCDNGDCVSLEFTDCGFCNPMIVGSCEPPLVCLSTPKSLGSSLCHIPCDSNSDCPNFYCGGSGKWGSAPGVCYTCDWDF